MSKHKKKEKKQPVRSKKKLIIIISIIAVVVLAAGILGYSLYAKNYRQQNHAQQLDADGRYEYNYVLTVFGRNANLTGDSEVLVVDTITKTVGGDTIATFVIYKYQNESDLAAALRMTPEEIAKNSNYEYVGLGEVTLVDDEYAGMCNMKPVYVR